MIKNILITDLQSLEYAFAVFAHYLCLMNDYQSGSVLNNDNDVHLLLSPVDTNTSTIKIVL